MADWIKMAEEELQVNDDGTVPNTPLQPLLIAMYYVMRDIAEQLHKEAP